jgi:hypothetical protein
LRLFNAQARNDAKLNAAEWSCSLFGRFGLVRKLRSNPVLSSFIPKLHGTSDSRVLHVVMLSTSFFFTGVIRCRALFISRITRQPSHSLRSCSSPLQTKGHRTPSSDRSKGCTDHQPKSCKGLTGRNPHRGCVKCDCAFVGCLPSGHLITILVSKFWETARISSLWL